MGVSGYGVDQMYIKFLEYIENNSLPKVVILTIGSRDHYRNTLTFREYNKPSFVGLEDIPSSISNLDEIETPEKIKRNLSQYSYLISGLSRIIMERKILSKGRTWIIRGSYVSEKIIKKIEKLTLKNNSKFILIGLQLSVAWDVDKSKRIVDYEYIKWFENFCLNNKIDCINFFKEVKSFNINGPDLYKFKAKNNSIWYGHLNKEGNIFLNNTSKDTKLKSLIIRDYKIFV